MGSPIRLTKSLCHVCLIGACAGWFGTDECAARPEGGSTVSGPGATPERVATDDFPFGFRALEIFKVSQRSLGLEAVDLDSDGLLDFVVANNEEGTILLMVQKGVPTLEPPDPNESEERRGNGSVNEIHSDARFQVQKFYTEKMVTSLRVGDFSGDQKPDLAFYSDPAELEVVYHPSGADESWGSKRTKFPIRDGAQGPYALNATDLNGDGRLDLVLLGKGKTYLFYQKDTGGLKQPVVLHNAYKNISSVEVVDVNEDGLPDLVHFVPAQEESVLVRLQTPSGFGPEIGSRILPIAAWHLAPFSITADEEKLSLTLFTVQESTHRLKMYRWKKRPTEAGLSTTNLVAQRDEGGSQGEGRHVLLADADGDNRVDVLVSYPDTAQLEVYFQDENGKLAKNVTYPTFSGVNSLASADLDGDGTNEIVVASRKENALGVSRWAQGRLQFPETVRRTKERAEGEPPKKIDVAGPIPVLVAAAPLEPRPQSTDGSETVTSDLFVVYEKGGPEFFLSVLTREVDGSYAQVATVPMDLKGTPPSAMRVFDADGDGKSDVFVFVPYDDPYLFLQVEPSGDDSKSAAFEEFSRRPDFGLGQISELSPPAMTLVRLQEEAGEDDGTEIMVTTKNYVRALRLDADRRLQVVDQFGGRGAGSQLVGATTLNLDDGPTKEVVLLDRSSSSLEILARRDDGGYELKNTVTIPPFELVRIETRDMNSDGHEDLVIIGKEKIGILYVQQNKADFEEILAYHIDKEEDLGTIHALAVGDLNGDDEPDLVVTTAPRYNLLCLTAGSPDATAQRVDGDATVPNATPDAENALERRLIFPLFEEKSFMRRNTRLGPRHMLVADVDGDQLQDLVLLIHDRILLYFQDGGPQAGKLQHGRAGE